MKNSDLNGFAVRVDGLVDIEATCEKFRARLVEYVESSKNDLEETTKALETVYGSHALGVRFSAAALVSAAMGQLKASPAAFATVQERVLAIIKTDPRFHQQKGRNGGVCFIPPGYAMTEDGLKALPAENTTEAAA